MTEAPTVAAMTIRTVMAVCDMPDEEESVELVCVGVGALLVVRYRMDWDGGSADTSLAWADDV